MPPIPATLFLAALTLPAPCPPLSDLGRFPGREVSGPSWRFAAQYRRCLEARRALEPHRAVYWDRVGGEAAWCATCWRYLDDAHDDRYGEDARRDSLYILRDQLGPADYYAGRMPPPVPLWRFAWSDP